MEVKHRRASRRSRWILLLVAVVALAVVGSYAIAHLPGGVYSDGGPFTAEKVPADTDGDGLPDGVEESGWRTRGDGQYRTDPNKADTDGDGLTDGDEAGALVTSSASERVYVGISDPTKADSDDDGLVDRAELQGWTTQSSAVYRTEPMNPDTDGDGLYDGDEAGALVASDVPVEVYSGPSSPLLVDTDGDGLGDADEADLGLDAFDRDSDDDQIEDGREVQVVGSSPDMADTDGDGFEDGYEETNRESQGLDPLWVDVKVDKWDYAFDFAKGAVAGDLWREDSIAWLAGNLASGGASFIPGVGWIVGTVADVRDAIGSGIRADWVGLGFSAVGLIPDVGDAVAIPGKAARFVARYPELAAVVAATIVALNKVPEDIKVQASRQIWKSWDDLLAMGSSEKALLRLQEGRINLDELAAAIKRSTPVKGPDSRFVDEWRDGEKYLEDLYGADVKGVTTQVRASTEGCIDVCNISNIRFFDVFVDGVAHESKVGYKTLSAVEKQIRSDAYLIKNGVIEGAHWHFFASGSTNKLGASPKVLDLLDQLGIPYTIHLPAKA